ncbi:hypothetical protein [Aquimarina sp. 2201CG5-10]|uniref:hypothetical protein n=1 Tax=Aquimarina callyspongiae TaxID=3098150 RepID=UPI002AB36231|nr:hypothetical protein [Aquimarina sp. 2201CG5-10]MDY8136945.1 hypothetical protein [Aquimarina sp. 2201CG5-10]
MKTNLLTIDGITRLSKKSQSTIKGQAGVDLSLCGCSCRGSVTGPAYCSLYIGCPHVYSCEESS